MPLYKPSSSLLAISANAQEASTTVGPAGSFKWNYEDKQLHVYDGVTLGGFTRSFEADGAGGGIATTTPYDDFDTIMSTFSTNLASYQNPSFYNYTLGSPQISDGGGDMYDNGNYTHIRVNGSQVVSNLDYTTTSTLNYNSQVFYKPVAYNRPLMMVAVQTPDSSFRYGMGKTGNLGADGGGTTSIRYIHSGDTVNGFTVWAYARSVYSASDPSVNDLYINLTHTNWDSTFSQVDAVFGSTNTDSGDSYFEATATNSLTISLLLSKNSGVLVSTAEMQTIIQSITEDLSTALGWS